MEVKTREASVRRERVKTPVNRLGNRGGSVFRIYQKTNKERKGKLSRTDPLSLEGRVKGEEGTLEKSGRLLAAEATGSWKGERRHLLKSRGGTGVAAELEFGGRS